MASLSNSFRQNFSLISAPAKLLFLLLLVLGFALFGSLLAMVIAMPVFNLSIFQLSEVLRNPEAENIPIIKFFKIFQSITLFIIPSLIAAWFFSAHVSDYIKINRAPSLITAALVTITVFTAIPLLNKITEFNMGLNLPERFDKLEQYIRSLEDSAGKLTELFLVANNTTSLMLNFLMIAILPAIGEEFLFRGVVQRLFMEWTRNGHLAIVLTAFIFSFIHFQFYGFVPRFLLGLFFGYLLFWSGSIWVPVIGHLINNGMAVIYYHYAPGPVGETTMDTIGKGNGNYLLYLSVFLTSLLIGMIYLHERSSKKEVRVP